MRAVVDAMLRLGSFALVSTLVDNYFCIVELVDTVSKNPNGVNTEISRKTEALIVSNIQIQRPGNNIN